jgi:glycosyltransferase involved in cell wall biosynthesis
MKAIIHNPYWNSWGGGERYVSQFCKKLVGDGWDVDVDWVEDLSVGAAKRFGISLAGVKFVSDYNSINYDLAFWVSDGSLPLLFAKKNIIHLQFPFINVNGRSWSNVIKSKFGEFVVNSQFTKRFIDREYGVNSQVLYPPIDVEMFQPLKKENIILYVGRFSRLTQQKGQEILIDNFKKLKSDWRLILAGGAGVGADNAWLVELEKKASKNKVEIIKNPSVEELVKLYGKAKIFWSACGYGVDENINPLSVEHFGITVVEAMAAGCVPIITNLGGHKEIVNNGRDGFLWNTTKELLETTQTLIKKADKLYALSQKAREKSKMFSVDNFYEKIDALVVGRFGF